MQASVHDAPLGNEKVAEPTSFPREHRQAPLASRSLPIHRQQGLTAAFPLARARSHARMLPFRQRLGREPPSRGRSRRCCRTPLMRLLVRLDRLDRRAARAPATLTSGPRDPALHTRLACATCDPGKALGQTRHLSIPRAARSPGERRGVLGLPKTPSRQKGARSSARWRTRSRFLASEKELHRP